MANGEDALLGYDINGATGNLFLAQPDILVHPASGPDLYFTRYYNSQGNGRNVGFGPHWSHSFSWSLTASASQVLIEADTGREILFNLNSAGAWAPAAGEFGSLVTVKSAGPSGSGTSGYTYTSKFGTAYVFDATGRLTSIQPADNSAISIVYAENASNPNQIAYVASGNLKLVFTYAGNHISAVTDPAGAQWAYQYLPPTIRVAPNNPSLSQIGQDNLFAVVKPNGSNAAPGAPQGMTVYAYSGQTIGGTTFGFPAGYDQTGLLTGYAVITSIQSVPVGGPGLQIQREANEAILGLFNYGTSTSLSSPVVIEAASGIAANQLLRDVRLSYAVAGPQFIATATLNGGSKTITSTAPDGQHPRLASIVSTAGSGTPGELASERWIWGGNLTLATHTDAYNVVTQYAYDTKGNPATITEAHNTPLARTTKITYHPVLSTPLTITVPSVDGNPNDVHTITWDYHAEYDSNYNCTQSAGLCTLTNYVHQIVESGSTLADLSATAETVQTHVVQIHYDAQYRISSISGPLGSNSTSFDYTPTGGYLLHVTRTAAPGQNLTTTYGIYDLDGRPVTVIDPNGNSTTTVYDPTGLQISKTISAAGAGGSSTETTVRDLAGDVTQQITPGGTSVGIEYDGGLRPWRRTGRAAGASSALWSKVTDFDSFNRPVTNRIFSGEQGDKGPGCTQGGLEQRCRDLNYDPYERVIGVHTLDPHDLTCPQPANPNENCTLSYVYDNDGRLLEGPGDLRRGTAIYSRDQLGRIVSITNRAGSVTTLMYDQNDHVNSRRDGKDQQNGGSGGNGRVTTYTYDDFGHLVKVVSPDIGTWTNIYDAAGNLVASKDAAGSVLTYQYDGLNRRTLIIAPVPNDAVIFNYDETGSLNGLNSWSYSNTQGRLSSIYTHDAEGNELSRHFSYDYRGWLVADCEIRPGGLFFPKAYTWGRNHELQSVTHPSGLVVSMQYPAGGGYAPKPRPSEIDAGFNGQMEPVASNIQYFADRKLSGLSYGNGSTLQIGANTRGEITSITSGPVAAPLVQQAYAYDANEVGWPTAVSYFQTQPYGWQAGLSYLSLGNLYAYTTNIRSPSDNYAWGYDEVGNRMLENYNGAIRTYCYNPADPGNCQDSANLTNQLTSAGGFGAATGDIAGEMLLSYDANGNVAYDTVATSQLGAGGYLFYQFLYNSRHHLKEIDEGWADLAFGIPYKESAVQTNTYDGLDRIAIVNCPAGAPLPGNGFGVCAYGGSAGPVQGSSSGGVSIWHEYFFDMGGKLLEEYESNGVNVNKCPAFDITDHVYLGKVELARVVSRYQATSANVNCVPGPWPASDPASFILVPIDVLFLHNDLRGAIVAAESKQAQKTVWAAEVSPFGQVVHVGLPDARMRIVDGANTVTLTAGAQGALPDGQLGEYVVQQGEMDPSAGRSIIPGQAVFDPAGPTTYNPVGPLSACGAGCADIDSVSGGTLGGGTLGRMLTAMVLARPSDVPDGLKVLLTTGTAYLAVQRFVDATLKLAKTSVPQIVRQILPETAAETAIPILQVTDLTIKGIIAAGAFSAGFIALLPSSPTGEWSPSDGGYGQSPGAFGNTGANPAFGDAPPTSPVDTPQSSSSDFALTPPFQPADPFFNAIFPGGPTVQPQNQAEQPVPQLSCDMCVPLPPPPSWQGTIVGPLDTPPGGWDDNQ